MRSRLCFVAAGRRHKSKLYAITALALHKQMGVWTHFLHFSQKSSASISSICNDGPNLSMISRSSLYMPYLPLRLRFDGDPKGDLCSSS